MMKQTESQMFSVRSDYLPTLLTEVVIDVDNKISGRRDDRNSIRKLRNILYDWQEKGVQGLEETTLFAESIGIENFAKGHLSEVPLKVNLLIREFDSYENLSMQSLKELKSFSVDLSKNLSNYLADFYDNRVALQPNLNFFK